MVSSNDFSVSVMPLSYAQKALYVMQVVHPHSVAYNIPFAYQFDGVIDPLALEQAINIMVARHETFRTAFRLIENEPQQIIYPQLSVKLEVVDCRGRQDADSWIREQVQALAQTPFDLSCLPLMTTYLYQKADQSFIWFFNIHHIIVDHLSVLQLAQEISANYQTITQGGQVDSAPVSLHYGDYAVWQNQHIQGEYLDQLLGQWQDRIDDPSACLALPTVFSRPAKPTGKGRDFWFELPKDLSQQVRQFAKNNNASLYMVMLAAYGVLLHHYTGEAQIVIGSPFANRGEQDELQKVMGCFTNALPLVLNFKESADFFEVLQQVKKSVLHAFSTQELPFEKLVESLKPHRDPSANPIFQVAFLLQDPPMEVSLAGIEGKSFRLHSGTSKFDSLIWLWETPTQLAGLIEYSTELFDQAFIETFLQHYQQLLGEIIACPELDVGKLSLVTQEDERQIHALNQTQQTIDLSKTLPQLIQAVVSTKPDEIAVVGENESLTYKEIEQQSNQLAYYLIGQGVVPGDYVGLSLERDAAMIVGMLGILKTGAAYVPLDPDYPSDRLAYMIENAKAHCVVTETAVLERLDFQVKTILVDQDADAIDKAHASLPEIDSEHPAYVIYTSGSTGKPKGVVVPHRAVVNLLGSMQVQPGFCADDRLLALTTLSFDIAVVELYLPLVTGSRVILATSDQAKKAEELVALIDQHSINFIQATPATWRLLIHHGWQGVKPLTAIVTGEPFPQDLVEPMLGLSTSLWDFYGPTETTVYSTCQPMHSLDEPITIGRPLANTQCYIVNQYDQLLPPGIAGEMLIGGQGVSHGYLNQPQLTAERFIDNPWGSGKLYRTGDRVTLQANGILKYHERLDQQVKIRGFRIELGEIETHLLTHPDVSACAVVVQGEASSRRLVAFYIQDSQTISLSELRQHMASGLPAYMIPDQWFATDELPLTPSGKVDRKKLKHLEVTTVTSVASHLKPSSMTERYYANLWCELIKLKEVSVEDNFFDIGGHSLLALTFMSRVKKEQQIELTITSLMMNTLGQLSQQYPLTEDDASEDSVIRQSKVEPKFIGQDYQQIYTVYHPAQGDAQHYAVLVCNPFGQEYMRSHRAVRTLIAQLSAQGIPCLRFDYLGTGDSSGNSFSIDQAISDAQMAARYLQQRSGCHSIKVLGIRLGAAIASYAFAKDSLVNHFSFWDPVIEGNRYLEELSGERTSRLHFREDQWWINGFMLSLNTRQQISDMNLLELDFRAKQSLHVVYDAQLKENILGFVELATQLPLSFIHEPMPSYSSGDWGFVDGEGGFIQPYDILSALKSQLGVSP